jgi:hypothetical protein
MQTKKPYAEHLRDKAATAKLIEDAATPGVNKGLPVHGYRPQSDKAVSIVNKNKEIEETVLRLLDVMANSNDVDKRWLAIGRTHIEQGFMAINRAVFQPMRFKLQGDAE